MGYESSTIYTMGSALSRALDEGAEVSVLVNGIWLRGTVAISDGTGVVLDGGDEHWVVKVTDISAIRIGEPVPGAARTVPTQGGASY